jgi:Carboxypeptidase regulatory-like domain
LAGDWTAAHAAGSRWERAEFVIKEGMMRLGFVRSLLVAGILIFVCAASANAQAIGSIFGKVTDTSGAVLPGVTVTVTGTGLQQPLVAVTSSSGTYQFPSVPIGTYTVSFELGGFKKAARADVIIVSGFNASIDQKLELGALTEEVTVSGESPVVDLKKTTTSAVFTAEVLEKIPTARDPWQIIGMTPGVRAGLNVGGSASGQQVGLNSRGTSANVQWNLEGGSITDLSSNSSPSYFNFDSFEQIHVTNGGGDVSVQSSGLAINLVTKSGSNVFKGSATAYFENDRTQSSNVTEELFNAGANGFLSGAPIQRIGVYAFEYGGPIVRDRLWFWGSADYQDINAGVVNFFDANKGQFCADLVSAQRARQLTGAITYNNLEQVEGCLNNDKTIIKNLLWKINYQLNSANKFQYLFQSDNKYRNRRGASSTTLAEATTQQTSDAPWKLPLPTHSITHTLIASDRLVFNNQFTYVGGGFFLDYQDVPPQGDILQSRYLGTDNAASYLTGTRASPDALWNVQALTNRTTTVNSRSLTNSYQTVRKSWEAKMDGTYFLTNKLGGDHSLKFGVGWRRNPIMSFSHYSGGARAHVQCVGNNNANCGDGNTVPVGSAAGIVPYQAVLYRDQLLNNDWWTYNGYIQDSFATGRWRFNGGVRYDWQYSKYLGGCVPENVLRPDLLPAQCEEATDSDPTNGRKLQSFSNWSPRVSATYDLFGTGKTSIKVAGSYYYATRITLANSLGGLATQTTLTWGPNASSGACSTTAGASCWNDANRDTLVQINELIGTPTSSNARFVNGVLRPAGNNVDPSAQIGRTREAIVGVQHELFANLAVGVDYIYRKYDRGTAGYTAGFEPGSSGFPLSQIYSGPLTHTDPVTGLSAPYYVICNGCMRPSGAGEVVMTNPRYQTYSGVDLTFTKRFSNRWQAHSSLTIQTNPNYIPIAAGGLFNGNNGSNNNPTGIEFQDAYNTVERYIFKAQGSYTFPWEIIASANLNIYEGQTRTLTINGPGQVYGGVNASGAATTINYNTLEFTGRDAQRFKPIKLLDLGAQKVFEFNGGRQRVKLILDAFNVFNVNTITAFSSGNLSLAGYTQPSTIVPPRVFRVGTALVF